MDTLVRYISTLITYAFAATIIGLLAARKNRNGWAWGLIGGIFLVPGLLVLMFMPYLCPACRQPIQNKEWKSRTCPRCGNLAAMAGAGLGERVAQFEPAEQLEPAELSDEEYRKRVRFSVVFLLVFALAIAGLITLFSL